MLVWLVVFLSLTSVALSAGSGLDATGDQHRMYVFDGTGDALPYRLFVPDGYRAERDYPLVVVLHGGGVDQNGPMDQTGLPGIAQKRGYIVLSPLGFNRFGGYGNVYPVVVSRSTAAASGDFAAIARAEGPGKAFTSPAVTHPDAADRAPAGEEDYAEQPAGLLSDAHVGVLSEAETLAAISDVRKHYRIDGKRIYLMGNSAGGVGTLYLAAKFPQMWAAIAPEGGVIAAWSYPYWRLRDAGIAAFFVHGERDEHCHWIWSRAMVTRARADGVDASLFVVPGGRHGDGWTHALPQIFDFFDAHRRATPSAAFDRD